MLFLENNQPQGGKGPNNIMMVKVYIMSLEKIKMKQKAVLSSRHSNALSSLKHFNILKYPPLSYVFVSLSFLSFTIHMFPSILFNVPRIKLFAFHFIWISSYFSIPVLWLHVLHMCFPCTKTLSSYCSWAESNVFSRKNRGLGLKATAMMLYSLHVIQSLHTPFLKCTDNQMCIKRGTQTDAKRKICSAYSHILYANFIQTRWKYILCICGADPA